LDGSCDKDEDSEDKLLDLITQNNLTFAFFIPDLFSLFSDSQEFFLFSDERNLLKC